MSMMFELPSCPGGSDVVAVVLNDRMNTESSLML
jgi:hypothetical protein